MTQITLDLDYDSFCKLVSKQLESDAETCWAVFIMRKGRDKSDYKMYKNLVKACNYYRTPNEHIRLKKFTED